MLQKLVELDVRLTGALRIAERPGWLRTTAVGFAHSGDSWFWLAGLMLLWWLGTPEWRGLAQIFALGVLFLAVLVLLIKFTVRRKRPEGTWGSIYRSTDPHSFPSGHAARASLLAILGIALGPEWLGVLLLIWAPLVSLARVALGIHYLSDVFAGLLLGLLMGLGVLQLSA